MKIVIVGGVAGGATAAARIRRLDEQAQICIFERSNYISYANCGLPYFVGGVIRDPAKLTLQTPESFFRRFRIDVKVLHEVIEIHPEKKTVTVHRLDTGEIFEESYDTLVLSPGAKPIQPPLNGISPDKIFTLRTVEDTFRIRGFVENFHPRTAVVAGGGYIGLEVAENLVEMGVDVTLVQRPRHLLNSLDYDMASFVHTEFRKRGVHLKLGSSVAGFEEDGSSLKVLLKDEMPLQADMVVWAVGVIPDTYLAEKAGLELGMKKSILVNERMQTSNPHIYAAGDAVEIKHFVTGNKALVSLAGPANKQARIAANNICGGNSTYSGAQGSSVIKVFDMTVAATGINETAAKAAGLDYDWIVLAPPSHASYYPGSKTMAIKMLFEKETERILGAQIVGFDGVDKRIDVIATAMRADMKASELGELDLAYAPPYSSAKDPVNIAGLMIENIIAGKVKQFHYEDLERLPHDGSVTLLDTRMPFEYQRGTAEGFINIPLDELRSRMDEIPKNKPVYVMCQSGLRSYIACRILTQNGYDCYNLAGGYYFYSTVKYGYEPESSMYLCGIKNKE